MGKERRGRRIMVRYSEGGKYEKPYTVLFVNRISCRNCRKLIFVMNWD